MFRRLKDLIERKSAKICIVGLGYVGLPIAIEFAKRGFVVYGVDTQKDRIASLKKGVSYIDDVRDSDVKQLLKKTFFPTTELKLIGQSDVIIICVPTPLRKTKIPNISYIIAAAENIAKYMRKGQLIVLESTTYPGTTRDVVLPILEEKGLKEDKDFFLAFSPERIDPGNKIYTFSKIPKVVGGISIKAGEVTKRLYSKVIDKVILVSSTETAEVVKLLENTFRIVNIGLINEFAMLCDRLKLDVWEVVEAARTKPFGFMPFYPGPGIGGHCLAGKETVFVKNGKGIETTTIDSFVEKISKAPSSVRKRINGTEYLKPASYQMLTFDIDKGKVVFKPISMLSKRRSSSELYNIVTNDNRQLTVTDRHPMFIFSEQGLKLKLARDLKIGDKIPFALETVNETLSSKEQDYKIDIIEKLKQYPHLITKTRVRPGNFSWSSFKESIYRIKFDNTYYHDYIRRNSLPLKYFLNAEKKGLLHIKHKDLLLCSGRGPSYNQIPAVIDITSDFCRLIGYYLSEGCITKDKSIRVRFSFGADEKEYINDLYAILEKIGIKYSTYQFKKWKTLCIKVSSNLFGILLKDILLCGKNSYEMNVPSLFLILPKAYKWELLKGLLRGDGGVDIKIGTIAYEKNGRKYNHFSNSASVNYFSSSKKLFQQVVFLLQEFGIVPTFKKREGLLYINGHQQIIKLKDIFLGDKKAKLDKYLLSYLKIIPNRSFQRHNGFAVSTVKSIQRTSSDYVYSAEVEDTHTIVTSYGTIVHNCIPKDPLYLSWKARKVGFKTRMIDSASKTNLFMPHYVVHRTEKLLRERGRDVSGAKILVLGVTYKKDVRDLRESPALEIIESLQEKRAKVSYSDPYLPYLNINVIKLKSRGLTPANIREYDLVILTTDHKKFNYKMIARAAQLILDTRNAFGARGIQSSNIVKL